ncbi:MAG: Hsp70 family protein [Opitutales bacterium]
MAELIVGIDLGTTNSAIAWLDDEGAPHVIPIDGASTMPSCVGIDPSGQLIVGQRAKNQLVAAPDATVLSIKRQMGTSHKVQLGERELSPEEVSAFILRELKEKAEAHLGQPVKKAVVTVPAFFDEHQRRATQNAGDLAGLDVVRIINEPTAAALAYESGHEGDRRLLVYDLGGGTFDVSVVVVEKGVVEVKASHGDTHLGGDDFDELLMRHVEERFEKEHGKSMEGDLKTKRRLRIIVEQAKCKLSDEPVVRVREEYIDGEHHLDIEIERNVYEDLISSYLRKTLDCVSQALGDAHLLPSDIDRVMLVGGSTRTPLVQRLLTDTMKKEPHFEIDPDLIVALGAAIQGGTIAGRESRSILVDITPHGFGTAAIAEFQGMMRPVCVPVIPRNMPLPVTKSEIFYTMHDDQEKVHVEVYEGEDALPEQNLFLGDFRVEGLSKAPAGNPIITTFRLDLNGMLHVTAREKSTGLSKSVSIDTRSKKESLDLEQARVNIAQLIKEGEGLAKSDKMLEAAAAGLSVGEAESPAQEEMLQVARDLKKRAEALLRLNIDPGDAEELRSLIDDSGKAVAAHDWGTLSDLNDRVSDLLFYLED